MTPTAAGPKPALCPERLADVLALHFDPLHGTPFWLQRAAALGFDPRDRIRDPDDLALLGPLRREDLEATQLRTLVPRSVWRDRAQLMASETGGTSGTPLRTVYSREEFQEGFVEPFLHAARARRFPLGGSWLFLGPSGPHVIHRAARAFARAGGALEPFCVDLDPRWARAQTPGSFGAREYRRHVVAQAVDVLEREAVSVLFATPPVLQALSDALPEEQRHAIRGIHVGGMAFDAAARARLRAAFPYAVLLPAYGNSLAGIAPELASSARGAEPRYAVPAGRLRFRIVRAPEQDLFTECAPGERGRVVLDRIDRSFLIANLIERDDATAVAAPPEVVERGFQPRLIEGPGPTSDVPAAGGLY